MGLLGSLFGGSKSKSSNQAFGTINSALSPTVGATANVFNSLGDELGGGFDKFKDKSGFNFALNQGMRNISGGGAARGLLNSGSTSKALAKYETDLGSQTYGNYLGQLMQLLQGGTGLAGILSGAGQQSSGKSSNGILGSLFSDRRVKTDIKVIGQALNGLTIYSFRYKDAKYGDPDVTHIGFMADEVEAHFPDAVTENEDGIKIVDYGKAVL